MARSCEYSHELSGSGAKDLVAMLQIFLEVLRFTPVNIIPPWLFTLVYHVDDEQ
jgi:quinol-cytochrome oxidoreductase complex cytochrome b subunit